MRRALALLIVMLVATAARADALSLRDLIELSHAGLSDEVLIALVDVDHPAFTVDSNAVKQLKQAGVSDGVILEVIRSAETPALPAQPAQPDQSAVPAADQSPTPAAEPQPPAPVAVPVPVPVVVPVAVPVFVAAPRHKPDSIKTTVRTDDGGEANVRVPLPPNCTKADPVYWGFGGKLRPNSWAPPPSVVCR